LEPQELVALTHHPAGSRVLDAIIDGATTPPRARRTLLRALEAHFADVIDDRIGSRVGARCWAAADPYLKVRTHHPLINPIAADSILFFDLGEARACSTPSCGASRRLAVRADIHARTWIVAVAAQTGGVAPLARYAVCIRICIW
jgi:hypothetical protein